MGRRKPHVHDTATLNPNKCPPPCGSMHSYCTVCGDRQEPCFLGGPTLDRDAAIGHALLQSAVSGLPFLDALEETGWTVALHPRFGS